VSWSQTDHASSVWHWTTGPWHCQHQDLTIFWDQLEISQVCPAGVKSLLSTLYTLLCPELQGSPDFATTQDHAFVSKSPVNHTFLDLSLSSVVSPHLSTSSHAHLQLKKQLCYLSLASSLQAKRALPVGTESERMLTPHQDLGVPW
jgi:hypothetical protein